ncbi:MAG: hypothetical protein JXL67_08775 [Calditrichaeota bacterium]|nr:hypothetical protein [Calditrichota bacterium]
MPPKKSKLREKATRIPDVRLSKWDGAFSKYLKEVESLHNESSRSHRFSMLLQELLGVEPQFIEQYSAGVEKYLKVRQKDQILKGRADNLFGNVIIEFEANLNKTRGEAEEQLQLYTAILWSQEKPDQQTPFICIATDGIRFVSYTPRTESKEKPDLQPEDIELAVLEEIDWPKLKSFEIFYWLDRYFLRKEILPPTSDLIVQDFGLNSHAFQTSVNTLLSLWESLKAKSQFEIIYQSWEKYLRIVYGSDVTEYGLFVSHTYLATLAKLMSWTSQPPEG